MNSPSLVTDLTPAGEPGFTKFFACEKTVSAFLAGLAGFGWGIDIDFMPLSLLLAAAWSLAPNRLWAALIAVIYYCTASRGLPVGAATYFEINLFSGVVLWVAGCSLLAIPFAVLWRQSKIYKAALFPLVLLLVSVPPFGVVGWTNPLTSAGLLFPGTGLVGLVITVLIASLLALKPKFSVGLVPVVVVMFFLSPPQAVQPAEWAGINTSEKFDTGSANHLESYLRQRRLIQLANDERAENILFPESAAGLWTNSAADLWVNSPTAKTVFVGAEVPTGTSYDNALVRVSSEGSQVLYKQRMPVPISMYQPWAETGANAYWFADPVVKIGETKVGVLICYESLLVWPVIHSAVQADFLISVGNFWWAKDTSIPAIQSSALLAWSALFDLPLVSAANR